MAQPATVRFARPPGTMTAMACVQDAASAPRQGPCRSRSSGLPEAARQARSSMTICRSRPPPRPGPGTYRGTLFRASPAYRLRAGRPSTAWYDTSPWHRLPSPGRHRQCFADMPIRPISADARSQASAPWQAAPAESPARARGLHVSLEGGDRLGALAAGQCADHSRLAMTLNGQAHQQVAHRCKHLGRELGRADADA